MAVPREALHGLWGDIYLGASFVGVILSWKVEAQTRGKWTCSVVSITPQRVSSQDFRGQEFTLYLGPGDPRFGEQALVGQAHISFDPTSRQYTLEGLGKMRLARRESLLLYPLENSGILRTTADA